MDAFLSEHPILKSEYDKILSVGEHIIADPLIGLTIPELWSQVKYLAYFCTQFLITLGQDSFRAYKGLGSKLTSILQKQYCDKIIEEFLKARILSP